MKEIRTRVTMLINASADAIFRSFVEPEQLTKFWLSGASASLSVGNEVEWHFMVEGATATVAATRLDPGRRITWKWSSGVVDIVFEEFDGGTAVTLTNEGYPGTRDEQIEAALDGTEGFTLVLSDLKVLLETGQSPGLVEGKAKLIEARS